MIEVAVEGYVLRHQTARSELVLVEVPQKPYGRNILCPRCKKFHAIKTVHLDVNDAGTVIVSKGVLDELKLAGLPGFEFVTAVNNPPALVMNPKVSRAEMDYVNRKQYIYGGR